MSSFETLRSPIRVDLRGLGVWIEKRKRLPQRCLDRKGGRHIHFVNYLWTNLKWEDVWLGLSQKDIPSYGTHLAFEERERGEDNNDRDVENPEWEDQILQ